MKTAQERVIENYQKLKALTERLRLAASRGDWESLPEIQQLRADLLAEQVTAADSSTQLDEPSRMRKAELIRQILADEAEIRNLIHSGLAELEQELRGGRQEIKLLMEYRRHAG